MNDNKTWCRPVGYDDAWMRFAVEVGMIEEPPAAQVRLRSGRVNYRGAGSAFGNWWARI
jgi:hypothetical protein